MLKGRAKDAMVGAGARSMDTIVVLGLDNERN